MFAERIMHRIDKRMQLRRTNNFKRSVMPESHKGPGALSHQLLRPNSRALCRPRAS
jgi:hypothetical protein